MTGEYLHRGSSNRVGLYTGQVWPNVNGVDRSDSINSAKGLGRSDFDLRVGNAEVKSGGWTANFSYPVGKFWEVYATAIGNYRNGYAYGIYRYPNSIRSGGSFPASNSYSAAAAAKIQELHPNGYLPEENSKVRDYSFIAGIKGTLGSWRADLSQTYGRNSYEFLVDNSANYTQAYLNGVSSSELQTSFNSGKTKLYQAVTNLDFSKSHNVLQGLNTALGGEFRVDGYGIDAGEYNSYANLTTDNNLAGIAGSQAFSGFLPDNAGNWNRKSFAFYSDNELQITKQWLLTGALRYEHFSDFGSTLNYKFSTLYKITPSLSVRGAASSGFRAPSLAQIHYAKVTTLFNTVNNELDPIQSGTFTNDSKVAELLGIPKLKQETSRSYSLGATYKIFHGLDLTVDAYQIDIKNRIVLSNNFTGGTDAALTNALSAVGAGSAAVFANAIDTRSRGIEGVLSYSKSWGNQSLNVSYAHSTVVNRARKDKDGNFIIHSSSILENSGQASSYFNRQDLGRLEGYTPKNKDIVTANYSIGRLSTLLRFSYFGEVTYLNTSIATSVNPFTGQAESLDQTFKGKGLTDLSLSYKLWKVASITVGANNLFDVYPDKNGHYGNTSSGRFVYSRTVSQFGYNGRYVFGKLAIQL